MGVTPVWGRTLDNFFLNDGYFYNSLLTSNKCFDIFEGSFFSLIYLGLTRAMVGRANDDGNFYYTTQSLASLEFYLRALSQTEIAEAMQRSPTLPYNPKCTSDL